MARRSSRARSSGAGSRRSNEPASPRLKSGCFAQPDDGTGARRRSRTVRARWCQTSTAVKSSVACRLREIFEADDLVNEDAMPPPVRRRRTGDAARRPQRFNSALLEGKKRFLCGSRFGANVLGSKNGADVVGRGPCRAFLSRSPGQIVSGTNEDSTPGIGVVTLRTSECKEAN